MRNTPPHWDEEHPAVRAWLERPPTIGRVSRRSGRALQRAYDPTGPIPFPKQPTIAERTYAVRERLGIRQPSGRNRRVRLTAAFVCLFLAAGFTEQRFDTAVVLLIVGFALLAPELWADLGGDR